MSSSSFDDTLAAFGETSSPSGELDPPSSATPHSERIAGRYRIEGLLGVGGMGRVYRAYDEELGERVALKMLRPELLDSREALEGLRQEVKLARRVTHLNVARTFDIGEHEGQRFMTMELIEGAPLSELLAARGPLPPSEGLKLFAAVCAGVAAAHRQGIVHRDLKPGNVMVEDSGRVVVTDFGLARGGRGRAEGQSMASIGQMVGTPAYMAPEQVSALPLGPPADVYALGLIAFELLGGRPAWQGGSPLMVAARRVMEDAPGLDEVCPAASPALVELVARCLEREPSARFADAGALAQALEACRVDAHDERELLRADLDAARASLRPRTVAVLPFTQRGDADADTAGLRAGLTEDLCDVLAMTPGLRLRHASEGASADPVARGRELGVDVVILGRLRELGERLRVSVRVLGVADGFQLWAGRFERSVGEALALNDEVAQGVARALSLANPAARPAINDAEVVELYLQIRAATSRALMAGGESAELDALLERALSAAPDNPLILAASICTRGWLSSIFAGSWVTPQIEARLHTLLTSAPALAETWHAKAAVEFYGRRDAVLAVGSLRRALAINPGHVDARALLAFILLEGGLFDEAEAHGRRALWSDPTHSRVRVTLMHLHAVRGEWDQVTTLIESLDSPRWREQAAVASSRFSWWAGRWLGTPYEQLPASTQEIRSVAASHLVFTRQASPASLRQMAALMLAEAAPGSRARAFLRQIFAEAAAILGEDELAWRFASEAEEHGLLDTTWLAQNPLLVRVRSRPEAGPLLRAAALRSDAIRAAYEARAWT